MPGAEPPRVPNGLRDLMKSLTKEVLREKPPNIYEFSAQYFETMLEQKGSDSENVDYEPPISYEAIFRNRERNQVPLALVYSIIPDGLTELIKEFIKAVLRANPKNLCAFAVAYFRGLQRAKEGSGSCCTEYTAYENYFKSKERFAFSPYVKCTCGRTLGEGIVQGGGQQYEKSVSTTTTTSLLYSSTTKTTESWESRLAGKEAVVSEKVAEAEVKNVEAANGAEEVPVVNKYEPEEYLKAIYVIQRFFRRALKLKKLALKGTTNSSAPTAKMAEAALVEGVPKMSETAAALIIQRTLRTLFVARQQELKAVVVPKLENFHTKDEQADNISEANSYTSASTALLSAESASEQQHLTSPSTVYEEDIIQKTISEANEAETEHQNNSKELLGMDLKKPGEPGNEDAVIMDNLAPLIKNLESGNGTKELKDENGIEANNKAATQTEAATKDVENGEVEASEKDTNVSAKDDNDLAGTGTKSEVASRTASKHDEQHEHIEKTQEEETRTKDIPLITPRAEVATEVKQRQKVADKNEDNELSETEFLVEDEEERRRRRASVNAEKEQQSLQALLIEAKSPPKHKSNGTPPSSDEDEDEERRKRRASVNAEKEQQSLQALLVEAKSTTNRKHNDTPPSSDEDDEEERRKRRASVNAEKEQQSLQALLVEAKSTTKRIPNGTTAPSEEEGGTANLVESKENVSSLKEEQESASKAGVQSNSDADKTSTRNKREVKETMAENDGGPARNDNQDETISSDAAISAETPTAQDVTKSFGEEAQANKNKQEDTKTNNSNVTEPSVLDQVAHLVTAEEGLHRDKQKEEALQSEQQNPTVETTQGDNEQSDPKDSGTEISKDYKEESALEGNRIRNAKNVDEEKSGEIVDNQLAVRGQKSEISQNTTDELIPIKGTHAGNAEPQSPTKQEVSEEKEHHCENKKASPAAVEVAENYMTDAAKEPTKTVVSPEVKTKSTLKVLDAEPQGQISTNKKDEGKADADQGNGNQPEGKSGSEAEEDDSATTNIKMDSLTNNRQQSADIQKSQPKEDATAPAVMTVPDEESSKVMPTIVAEGEKIKHQEKENDSNYEPVTTEEYFDGKSLETSKLSDASSEKPALNKDNNKDSPLVEGTELKTTPIMEPSKDTEGKNSNDEQLIPAADDVHEANKIILVADEEHETTFIDKSREGIEAEKSKDDIIPIVDDVNSNEEMARIKPKELSDDTGPSTKNAPPEKTQDSHNAGGEKELSEIRRSSTELAVPYSSDDSATKPTHEIENTMDTEAVRNIEIDVLNIGVDAEKAANKKKSPSAMPENETTKADGHDSNRTLANSPTASDVVSSTTTLDSITQNQDVINQINAKNPNVVTPDATITKSDAETAIKSSAEDSEQTTVEDIPKMHPKVDETNLKHPATTAQENDSFETGRILPQITDEETPSDKAALASEQTKDGSVNDTINSKSQVTEMSTDHSTIDVIDASNITNTVEESPPIENRNQKDDDIVEEKITSAASETKEPKPELTVMERDNKDGTEEERTPIVASETKETKSELTVIEKEDTQAAELEAEEAKAQLTLKEKANKDGTEEDRRQTVDSEAADAEPQVTVKEKVNNGEIEEETRTAASDAKEAEEDLTLKEKANKDGTEEEATRITASEIKEPEPELSVNQKVNKDVIVKEETQVPASEANEAKIEVSVIERATKDLEINESDANKKLPAAGTQPKAESTVDKLEPVGTGSPNETTGNTIPVSTEATVITEVDKEADIITYPNPTTKPQSPTIGTHDSQQLQPPSEETHDKSSEQQIEKQNSTQTTLTNSTKNNNNKQTKKLRNEPTGRLNEPLIAEIHLKSFRLPEHLEAIPWYEALASKEYYSDGVEESKQREQMLPDREVQDMPHNVAGNHNITTNTTGSIEKETSREPQEEEQELNALKERAATYMYGAAAPREASNLARRAEMQATAFTIPLDKEPTKKPERIGNLAAENKKAKSGEETNEGKKKRSKMNATKLLVTATNQKEEKQIELESPTKLFEELNAFDETSVDPSLDVTYTVEEANGLLDLKGLSKGEPTLDEVQRDDDAISVASSNDKMLHTIEEVNESETPRPGSGANPLESEVNERNKRSATNFILGQDETGRSPADQNNNIAKQNVQVIEPSAPSLEVLEPEMERKSMNRQLAAGTSTGPVGIDSLAEQFKALVRAAITIQRAFRKYMGKKKLQHSLPAKDNEKRSTKEELKNGSLKVMPHEKSNLEKPVEPEMKMISGNDTSDNVASNVESSKIQNLMRAALIIQKAFRGYLARKQLVKMTESRIDAAAASTVEEPLTNAEGTLSRTYSITSNTPTAEREQHKGNHDEIEAMLGSLPSPATSELSTGDSEESVVQPATPDFATSAQAAILIQKTFRSFLTRQRIKRSTLQPDAVEVGRAIERNEGNELKTLMASHVVQEAVPLVTITESPMNIAGRSTEVVKRKTRSTPTKYADKSAPETRNAAALVIQTAFRDHLERRASAKSQNSLVSNDNSWNESEVTQIPAEEQARFRDVNHAASNEDLEGVIESDNEEKDQRQSESDSKVQWFVGSEPIVSSDNQLNGTYIVNDTNNLALLADSNNSAADADASISSDELAQLATIVVGSSSNLLQTVAAQSIDNENSNNNSNINLTGAIVSAVESQGNESQPMTKASAEENQPAAAAIEDKENKSTIAVEAGEQPEDAFIAAAAGSSSTTENSVKIPNMVSDFLNSERHFCNADKVEVKLSNTANGAAVNYDLVSELLNKAVDSSIPYEPLEEPICIKKTVSQTHIDGDEEDGGEPSNASDAEANSLEDALLKAADKLAEADRVIEKMQLRRASTTRTDSAGPTREASFDTPPVSAEPLRSPDTEEEDVVLQRLQRQETRESSAQSDVVIYGGEEADMELDAAPELNDLGMPRTALKRVHTIAGDDTKSLYKTVTIGHTTEYLVPAPPDSETTVTSDGSFCLDDTTAEKIREKMLAYSMSEADSDYYENVDAGAANSAEKDDFNINTALAETRDSSTETESTIVSAATKIQAGARGFLTRRRLRRVSGGGGGTKSGSIAMEAPDYKASFGNDAINESLERLVEDEAAKKIQMAYRSHRRRNKKITHSAKARTAGSDGVHHQAQDLRQAASLESSLAARRQTLQRAGAMQNDSAPDEERSSKEDPQQRGKSPNGEREQREQRSSSMTQARRSSLVVVGRKTTTTTKTTTNKSSTTTTKASAETTETTVTDDSTTAVGVSSAAERAKRLSANKLKWLAIRQNSMPVQIDSEILRILPRHLRKRIKSAEGDEHQPRQPKRPSRRNILK